MQIQNKRMLVLISEVIKPTMESINLFKESLKTEYVTDGDGTKHPIFKWKQILSNGSRKTGNGNLFPRMDIEPSINDGYVQNRVMRNAFFNEMEHPTRDNPERYMQVYDSKVSDRINKFWYETVNGEDLLFGDCETAIYSYGPELRKKILSGAVPAKSLRAAGEVYTDNMGRERKRLNIVAYDNVFMPADASAWGDMSTMQKSAYAESLGNYANRLDTGEIHRGIYLKGFDAVVGHVEEIATDKQLIAESLGFNIDKVMIDPINKNKLVYIGESIKVITTVDEKVKRAIDDFMKI